VTPTRLVSTLPSQPAPDSPPPHPTRPNPAPISSAAASAATPPSRERPFIAAVDTPPERFLPPFLPSSLSPSPQGATAAEGAIHGPVDQLPRHRRERRQHHAGSRARLTHAPYPNPARGTTAPRCGAVAGASCYHDGHHQF